MRAISQVRDEQVDPIIREVLQEMGYAREPSEQEIMYEDNEIMTTTDIINGLKSGRIPGTAIIRWDDDNGMLEANVIDFLLEEKISSVDVETGENLEVKSTDIPDGAWRLFS